MRIMKYLSPSSMKKFYEDRELFYMEYLSDNKKIREPQTTPMAVGSAFDAFVKSDLHKRFVNNGDPTYTLDALFESQVEPHNRDVAKVDGKRVYDFYISCGAMADIVLDMEGCIGEPRFETKLEGTVRHDIGDVTLLGKPDIYFLTKEGARIIFDWKVNGYYSNSAKSPEPGYKRTRPDGEIHKKYHPTRHNGYEVNGAYAFEAMNLTTREWAAQLSTYAWLLGEPIGAKTILAVDQIACNRPKQYMRVAQHRGIASEEFQRATFESYARMWQLIKSGHIFDEMSFEENEKKIRALDAVATVMNDAEFRAGL